MNIQTFINQLSQSNRKDYRKILNNFDFSQLDFSEIENWLPDCYTRNCFYRDAHFELILICWDKGQQTAVHNHDGEECWVYLLEGEIEEDFYALNKSNKLEFRITNVIQQNEITYSGKFSGFHRLRNNTDKRALSLHVYAKPIEKSLTYNEDLDMLIQKKLSDNTYLDLGAEVKIN